MKKTYAVMLGAMVNLYAGWAHATPEGIGNCEFTSGNFAPGVPGGVSGWIGHPCPQPRPGSGGFFGSQQTLSADGTTHTVVTPEGQHAPVSPFTNPPGSNFLLSVDSNLYDFNGVEMPNTQPSRLGDDTYLLHDGPVLTKSINKTSPSEDLDGFIDKMEKAIAKKGKKKKIKKKWIKSALDILEGNKIKNRAYSGFPMLHYNGPNKIKAVEPICAAHDPCRPGDEVTGGNVDVNLIYWDQHIEGDTAMIDPSAVQDVPWTITYRISILTGGIEDFSPMTMHFDRTPADTRGPFHAAMDQTYFPMLDEGKNYTIKIKQTYGKHYNLTYTWGWRIHPPRVQVTENATKMAGSGEPGTSPKLLTDWEIDVFGEDPMGSKENQLAAIAQIGDLSPAKRMWNVLRSMLRKKKGKNQFTNATIDALSALPLEEKVAALRAAYLDWSDRTKLPAGVEADPDATITLFYVNNTIYGSRQGLSGEGSGQGPASFKGICNGCAHDWDTRPYNFKVTLLNGDHFVHGYMNVDFGGTRGWENLFQDTDPTTALAEHLHTEETTIVGSRTDIVNGEVVISDGNVLQDHVLLDNTLNPGKADLAIDLATGETVVTNDRIFPFNTGGTEEFLEPTPRDENDPINGLPQMGSGCFFTFGRQHAWPTAGGPWGPIHVPPVAADGTPGLHKVEIEYNYEPTRRLKIYQFDPLHHDIAVYSLH